jgi:hypothetical protein
LRITSQASLPDPPEPICSCLAGKGRATKKDIVPFQQPFAYDDLRDWMKALEKTGELMRYKIATSSRRPFTPSLLTEKVIHRQIFSYVLKSDLRG